MESTAIAYLLIPNVIIFLFGEKTPEEYAKMGRFRRLFVDLAKKAGLDASGCVDAFKRVWTGYVVPPDAYRAARTIPPPPVAVESKANPSDIPVTYEDRDKADAGFVRRDVLHFLSVTALVTLAALWFSACAFWRSVAPVAVPLIDEAWKRARCVLVSEAPTFDAKADACGITDPEERAAAKALDEDRAGIVARERESAAKAALSGLRH